MRGFRLVIALLLLVVGASCRPPKPPAVRVINWQGQDTGYKGRTLVQGKEQTEVINEFDTG